MFKIIQLGGSNFIEILESFNLLKNSVGNSVELYTEKLSKKDIRINTQKAKNLTFRCKT